MRSVRSCDDRWPMADADPPAAGAPTAAVVAFVTTEHFTLQGARSQTVSEATGRASVFLASVSGGLVAVGLLATSIASCSCSYCPKGLAALLDDGGHGRGAPSPSPRSLR